MNLCNRHLDSLAAMSSKITIAEADEAAADSGSSGPEPEILVCCLTTFEMKLKEKILGRKNPKFEQNSIHLTQLSTRVENMYEILKDISSELHNIRVSILSLCPINALTKITLNIRCSRRSVAV